MALYPYNAAARQRVAASYRHIVAPYLASVVQLQIAAGLADAKSADGCLAAAVLPDTGTLTVTDGLANPALPRNVSIVGNAAGITGSVVVVGTNMADLPMTETLEANGTTPVLGQKAFKTVASVTFPAKNAGGDTISVGFDDALGLPHLLFRDTVLMAFVDGAGETNLPTVATDSMHLEGNTFLLDTALAGQQIDLYYLLSGI